MTQWVHEMSEPLYRRRRGSNNDCWAELIWWNLIKWNQGTFELLVFFVTVNVDVLINQTCILHLLVRASVTSKKSPNVYNSWPKMILTPLQKLPKNVGDLCKLIVAKCFEKLHQVQYHKVTIERSFYGWWVHVLYTWHK